MCLSAILTACTPESPNSHTAATEYWAQPDTVVTGLGQPVDAEARSRDEVWVADLAAAAIFSVNPGAGEYAMIGAGDREPTQIEQPVKLALAPDIGLAAFDGATRSVDLFTFSGEFIRGFTPGFTPAVMGFSRAPLGFTFGIAEGDSGQDRRSVVIRTDLQGNRPDTLLSPAHGPEPLRASVARRGETAMTPSTSGMWVWSNEAPGVVYDLAPRGNRALLLRPEDRGQLGLLADGVRELLWVVRSGTDSITYAAYDARLARESADPSASAFLGTRSTGADFQPMAVHDGILMGVRRMGESVGMAAYDLHADDLQRADPEDD